MTRKIFVELAIFYQISHWVWFILWHTKGMQVFTMQKRFFFGWGGWWLTYWGPLPAAPFYPWWGGPSSLCPRQSPPGPPSHSSPDGALTGGMRHVTLNNPPPIQPHLPHRSHASHLPSVFVSCWRSVLAVMPNILWILQNNTTSLHSSWGNTKHMSPWAQTTRCIKIPPPPGSSPQSQQSVSGSSRSPSYRDYSGTGPSGGSGVGITDAMYPWSDGAKIKVWGSSQLNTKENTM